LGEEEGERIGRRRRRRGWEERGGERRKGEVMTRKKSG